MLSHLPSPILVATLAGGYALGSIPFGLLLVRLAGMGDVRSIGSGSIGATNVLRTGRPDLAAATLLLDGGKGALAVILAGLIGGDGPAIWAGFGAFLGHLFPIWLGFRGGKGVATALGLLIALAWPLAIAASLIWLATAALFRISSLAAITATLATMAASVWLALYSPVPATLLGQAIPNGLWQPLLLITLLILWAHRANIRRLLAGTEPKIGGSRG